MALIFDGFKKSSDAKEFAEAVTKKFKRRTTVWNSQKEMQDGYWFGNGGDGKLRDTFPFPLKPPIVLVERVEKKGKIDFKYETEIAKSVETFGGVFAGT
jgi:hypothetical protein